MLLCAIDVLPRSRSMSGPSLASAAAEHNTLAVKWLIDEEHGLSETRDGKQAQSLSKVKKFTVDQQFYVRTITPT